MSFALSTDRLSRKSVNDIQELLRGLNHRLVEVGAHRYPLRLSSADPRWKRCSQVSIGSELDGFEGVPLLMHLLYMDQLQRYFHPNLSPSHHQSLTLQCASFSLMPTYLSPWLKLKTVASYLADNCAGDLRGHLSMKTVFHKGTCSRVSRVPSKTCRNQCLVLD